MNRRPRLASRSRPRSLVPLRPNWLLYTVDLTLPKSSAFESMSDHGESTATRPSPAELQALWDDPAMAVAVVDPTLRITFANDAYAHLVMTAAADLPGKLLSKVAPLTAGVVAVAVARALDTNEAVVGVSIPYNFVELILDVLPVGARGADPRAVIVLVDPRRKRVDAPSGASGARRAFFDVARKMAWATTATADTSIAEALTFACETYDLDRAYVRLLSEDGERYVTSHHRERSGLGPLPPTAVPLDRRSWAFSRFVCGEPVVVPSIDDLPPEAADLRADLAEAGVWATVGVPVCEGSRVFGYVAYNASTPRDWPAAQVDLLRMVGELIAGVISRVRAERETQDRLRFEEMLSTAAASFVDVAPEDLDERIEQMLAAIGENRDFARVVVMQLDDAGASLEVTHEWLGPAMPSVKGVLARRVEDLSPITRAVLAGGTVGAHELDAPEGSEIRVLLARMGVRACILAPLSVEGKIRGLVNLQGNTSKRVGLVAARARANLIADVIAAALAHRAATLRRRQWERRFSRILASAMDGVALLDPRGDVREWSPQAMAVFSVSSEDILGRPFSDLVIEDDRAIWSTRLGATSLDAAAQRFEVRGKRPGGVVVPLELSMTKLEQPAGDLVVVFVRDISDRKQAEVERQRAFDEVSRLKRTAERERDYLREEQAPSTILGASPAIEHATELLAAVADSPSSVLLLGESGVGKEVFAAAIHRASARANEPFVKVNCASVPTTLFESEFFGHVKGSFTGAIRDRVGRFELADRGTLFLDEVGEIPLELQAKLLRVLQEGEIERVGEDRTRKVDVRVISATNRDLEKDVEAGTFRRDLYFRLSVFPLAVPPLRDRGDDVILLARHFLAKHLARAHRPPAAFRPADEARLREHDWPGNVRELDHVIERAVILSRKGPIDLDLALPNRAPTAKRRSEILREEDVRRIEKDNLLLALDRAKGRVSGAGGAAEMLGIKASTMRDRLRALGIRRDE